MLVVPRSCVVLLRLSVVACVSSVCAKSDGSRNFGIPHSQVCRTGRAKLNLSMRKNPHENAFSLFATLVKRVKTDRRPKNFIFSKPFFATKTTVFLHAHVSKTHAKTIFCIPTREKAKSPFRKKALLPPPPPTPAKSNFVGGSGVFEVQTPKKPGIRYVAVTLLLLLLAARASAAARGASISWLARAETRVLALSSPEIYFEISVFVGICGVFSKKTRTRRPALVQKPARRSVSHRFFRCFPVCVAFRIGICSVLAISRLSAHASFDLHSFLNSVASWVRATTKNNIKQLQQKNGFPPWRRVS